MPQISVIVNLRNGAATLREALDSALAQSFSDWELLVWDDCSTDDSAAIVAQYRDPRIRYLRSPDDTPLGKARQNAIAHARGEWLAFLDQDDIWLPRKLELQLALTAADVGMVYGRTVLFHAGDRNLRDYDYAHEFTPLPEGNIFPALFRDACFIAMSSALLRRTAVVECGGIPGAVEIIPDHYLYAAIAARHKVRAVQQVVARYRLHAGNMSRRNRNRIYEEELWLLERWQQRLDPRVYGYRRMTYSTALAWEEMKSARTAARGLRRLFGDGSALWLLGRPLVHAWRALRRRLRMPYWRRTQVGE